MNYEELEENTVVRVQEGIEKICYVANIDYDVGISIVFGDDKEREAICLHGKSSPFYKRY